MQGGTNPTRSFSSGATVTTITTGSVRWTVHCTWSAWWGQTDQGWAVCERLPV
jgi:hypothetical protein